MQATATKPQAQVRKSQASTLASLEGRTTTAAATATNDAGLKTGSQITGQYLLANFVDNQEYVSGKDGAVTRMDIIRTAAKNTDVQSMDAALNDMVEQAKKLDDPVMFPKNTGPKYRTAVSARGTIRRIYGALRFASKLLKDMGFNDAMGVIPADVIANKALKESNIRWNGTPAEDAAEKAIRLRNKAEEAAIAALKKAQPRAENESLLDYNRKIVEQVPAFIEKQNADNMSDKIDTEVARLKALGNEAIKVLIKALQASLKEEKASTQA